MINKRKNNLIYIGLILASAFMFCELYANALIFLLMLDMHVGVIIFYLIFVKSKNDKSSHKIDYANLNKTRNLQ